MHYYNETQDTGEHIYTYNMGNSSNGVEYIVRFDHVDGKNAK